MTTIAAKIEDNGSITIASDSCVSSQSIKHNSGPKIWGLGFVAWGWAGRSVLARWVEQNPPPKSPEDLDEWADTLRTRAQSVGAWDEGSTGGEALVCYAGRSPSIYYIGCDCSVIFVDSLFFAIGSGAHYALGAMAAGHVDAIPAVEIASRFDPATNDVIFAVETKTIPLKTQP